LFQGKKLTRIVNVSQVRKSTDEIRWDEKAGTLKKPKSPLPWILSEMAIFVRRDKPA
jgi:hypothetical protein